MMNYKNLQAATSFYKNADATKCYQDSEKAMSETYLKADQQLKNISFVSIQNFHSLTNRKFTENINFYWY